MSLPGAGPELSPADRRSGFLAGAVVGAALAASTASATDADAVRSALIDGEITAVPPPPGRRRAATALADALLLELTSGGVDLHRLARDWVGWYRNDGCELAPPLQQALDHLDQFDAPPGVLPGGNVAALGAALPAALASASPRAMVAGAVHVARLLDPDPATGLAAMSLVLAAAAFLEGRRDFVADVIAGLRSNDAPARLLDPLRQLPRDPRTPPPAPVGASPDPVDAAIWTMWMAYHRPHSTTALREMVLGGGVSADVGGLLGALLGARDGIGSWPERWVNDAGEEVVLRRALAARVAAQE